MNSKQRQYLRGIAHHLKPVVNIGKNGVTDGTFHCINDALKSHELIKIKYKTDKSELDKFINSITQKLSCNVVGKIGHIIIIYKQHEDPEKQKIKLP